MCRSDIDNTLIMKQSKRVHFYLSLFVGVLLTGYAANTQTSQSLRIPSEADVSSDYEWTTDHMQVGVRWQPFSGRPGNNAYDATRPVIAEDSSYAQFWVAWSASEPTEAHTDYENNMSGYLKTIEQAVDACVAEGLKVELVFWHCPAWASVSGKAGGVRPKEDYRAAFVRRMATHFKGRVHAYQLAHEANLRKFLDDGDFDVLLEEFFIKGARAIREVYAEEPAEPVVISTAGCSPCDACETLPGLINSGAAAIHEFYERLAFSDELMGLVDALNLNVSDHFDGTGNADGSYIPSVWANYDVARAKLDAAGRQDKKVMAAESWVVWDGAGNAMDFNGDGLKNEQDAYDKTLMILGRCLERGLNTANLPWSDNASGWAMGLTKRRDYNGRVKALKPDLVIPASDGGADIVTRKVMLQGNDDNFKVEDAISGEGAEYIYTIKDYINPSDPNHLHYYIWKWFAQISGGSDEVIRHAMAGEVTNDISVWGLGFTGMERYRLASYNRTKESFRALIYSSGASGKLWTKVGIPARIQDGAQYNNDGSSIDFRGEGFPDGAKFTARIVTKDISREDGSDVDVVVQQTAPALVADGMLNIIIGRTNKFTTIDFTLVEETE